MDPIVKLVGGVTLATLWGYIQYRNHKKPKQAPTLAAPPPNIHIDPENIPVVAEEDEAPKRVWKPEYASVPMGVPLKPRD